MVAEKPKFAAIVVLLKHPLKPSVESVQRAANAAYRGAPALPRVFALDGKPGFGIVLGPLRLAAFSVDRPYFSDAPRVAENERNFAARAAILNNAAWLSVDQVGETPKLKPGTIYAMIGRLVAEFLSDDVLGLIRLPHGPITGYDFSFIPKFRNGLAEAVFKMGAPDRTVKIASDDAKLIQGTAEAKKRWPEFLSAFAARSPKQGFAVKKKFEDPFGVEHMWVEVLRIEGSVLYGKLANRPNTLKSLQLGEDVALTDAEIEDWIFTRGGVDFGGFQAAALRDQ